MEYEHLMIYGGPPRTTQRCSAVIFYNRLFTSSEFETGAIAGSINIPFEELDNRNDELLKAKENPLVLICKMGRNAALAGEKMQKYGYNKTHVLKGGITTWQQEGLPLVKVK